MAPAPGRTVLHVDMDAFYVSVELRRRPDLRGKPVVVGGSGRRGVVAAASYEARRYGVTSAMSSAQAKQRCPGAIFLPGDHQLYGQVSAQVHELFHQITPLVEGIALDEAFLDVTGAARTLGTGTDIAHALRERVHEELSLSCSVGIATCKFLAKMASVAAKPTADRGGVRPGRGVVEVLPGEELAFLHPHPVQALWGVGPATLQRLQRLGVETVGDLAELGEDVLVQSLGVANGRHLHELAWGIDVRPVVPHRAAKSIGHEETFINDLYEAAEVRSEIVRLADAVAGRLRGHGVAARTLTLKVRYSNFETISRSTTVAAAIQTGPEVFDALEPLLASVDRSRGIRLLGVSAANLAEPVRQLNLLDLVADPGQRRSTAWADAATAIDEIRDRFGTGAIKPASTVGRVGHTAPGERPWGPDGEDSDPDD